MNPVTNISQLQPLPPSQVQKVTKQGEDKEATVCSSGYLRTDNVSSVHFQFLAFRLLNKRARVRLSASPLKLDDRPGRGVLFATANSLGCFAAVTYKENGECGACHLIRSPGLAAKL